MTDEHWRDRAACKGKPINLFYKDDNLTEEEYQPLKAQAKLICHTCPVRQECLDAGLRNAEYGIWGGLDKSERHNAQKGSRSWEIVNECDWCLAVFPILKRGDGNRRCCSQACDDARLEAAWAEKGRQARIKAAQREAAKKRGAWLARRARVFAEQVS